MCLVVDVWRFVWFTWGTPAVGVGENGEMVMSVIREWWRRCRRWFRFVPLFVRGLFPVAGVSLVMAPGEGGAVCSDLGGYSLIVRGRVAAWAGARVARGMFARDRRVAR